MESKNFVGSTIRLRDIQTRTAALPYKVFGTRGAATSRQVLGLGRNFSAKNLTTAIFRYKTTFLGLPLFRKVVAFDLFLSPKNEMGSPIFEN